MRNLKTIACTAAILLSSTAALAGDGAQPPSGVQVKALWDFYSNGWTNQAVVGEFKACLEVDTERGSETRFECSQPAEGTIDKGTKIYAWLAYVMPKGSETEDVMVQFKHNGIVRTTRDLTLKGKFFRNRSYTGHTLHKSGEWQIVVLQGGAELASASVTVQ